MNKFKNIIIAILVVLCFVLVCTNSCSHRQSQTFQTNIEALKDTLHTSQLRNGDLLTYQRTLLADRDELERSLGLSQSECRELRKKLGELEGVIKVETQIVVDTLVLHDSVRGDCLDFGYQDDWLSLSGTHCDRTVLNNLSISVPVTIGQTVDLQTFVTTPNPYVHISSIHSEIEVKKERPKKFALGLQLGVGAQYGIIHKSFDVGPYVGIGFEYNFIAF